MTDADIDDLYERVDRMSDDLYRTQPENPGAIIRLDRIEQLLSTMLKVGLALGGVGLLYQAFQVFGELLRAKAHAQ